MQAHMDVCDVKHGHDPMNLRMACGIKQFHGNPAFIGKHTGALLLVCKPSLAVACCRTHSCVSLVPFFRALVHKEHFLTMAQLRQGISE